MITNTADVTVIGGGVVGLSVAFGLLQAGHQVTVLDGNDEDFRASQGNFGLIWLQGKGADFAPYAKWTRRAISAWPTFAKALTELTGNDLSLDQSGGFEFFTDPSEFEGFSAALSHQQTHLGNQFSHEIFTGDEVRRTLPGIGPDVVGASYCELDGHINPLSLLRTLRTAVMALGVNLVSNAVVEKIEGAQAKGFTLTMRGGDKRAANRVVICAGLGVTALAEQLGFRTKVRPQRGELLITEKLCDRLPFLSSTIRQVNEGGIQIGGTKADVGYNDAESLPVMAQLAQHAVAVFPALADCRVIRSWGALRIMTPDGYPVYEQSSSHPDAYLVSCHSGVTLASLHASSLIDWIDNTSHSPDLEAFGEHRFSVSS